MSEWISVKDELPELSIGSSNFVSKGFLVTDGLEVVTMRYEAGKIPRYWEAWDDHPGMMGCEITHWMPLPEPPNE